MLDKPMTRSETDSNALPGGRLTRRHETNYARQRDVRNVTYRRDGTLKTALLNAVFNVKERRKQMTNKKYSLQGSAESKTVTVLQKEQVFQAVLIAAENGHYYDGLEEKLCQAISNINRFSDSKSITELVDSETGEIFRKID